MLKLTYTELGLHLERVVMPLEQLVANRVVLALRTGQALHVEPGRASFLLPADAPGLDRLTAMLRSDRGSVIDVAPVDADYVEVTLSGSWVAQSADAHEGMFLSAFSEKAEYYVCKLWEATQAQVSYLA